LEENKELEYNSGRDSVFTIKSSKNTSKFWT